jgi:hypothetical protein
MKMEVYKVFPQICTCCNQTFFSVDRQWVCGAACHDRLTEIFIEEQLGEFEGWFDSLLCDYVGGYISEAEFKKDMNMAVYEAKHIKHLPEDDVEEIVKKKINEFDVSVDG